MSIKAYNVCVKYKRAGFLNYVLRLRMAEFSDSKAGCRIHDLRSRMQIEDARYKAKEK